MKDNLEGKNNIKTRRWFRRGNVKFYSAVFILFIMLTFITESSYRFSVWNGLKFMVLYPLDSVLPAVFFTTSAAMLIPIIKKSRIILNVLVTAFWGLSIINFSVRFHRNVNVTLEDFRLVNEVKAFKTNFFSIQLIIAIVILLSITLLSFLLTRRISALYRESKLRIIYIAVPAAVFAVALLGSSFRMSFMMDFLFTSPPKPSSPAPNITSTAPPRTSARPINTESGSGPKSTAPRGFGIKKIDRKVRPNLIVIQSESFFNPNDFSLDYSINPSENFEKIRSQSVHGKLFVPVFGGGTCNTEFEVLTGTSIRTYSNNSHHLIYENDIKSPVQSVASILRKQGYVTKAVHPFHKWFFNRNDVYSLMGFHEFRAIEHMPGKKMYRDSFVSDQYITDNILKEIEKTKEPLFMMNITMQNHWPYNKDLDLTSPIKFLKPKDISEDAYIQIANYVNGVHQTDLALKNLIDGIKKLGEPTVVVFYSDHLPTMGENFKVYRQTGYFDKTLPFEDIEETIKHNGTDFFIWYSEEPQPLEIPAINSYYLGTILMDYIGAELPEISEKLLNAAYKYPLFSKKKLTGIKNTYAPTSSEYNDYYAFLWNYRNKIGMTDRAVITKDNTEYNKRLYSPKIKSVKKQQISGEGFFEGMELWADDKKIDILIHSDQQIYLKNPIPDGAKKLRLIFKYSSYQPEGTVEWKITSRDLTE